MINLQDIYYVEKGSNRDEQILNIISTILQEYNHSITEIDLQLAKDNAWKYSHGDIEYEKSLAYSYPELVKEWHPTLNGNITPDGLTSGSNKKVWWKCLKCDHEWQANVHNRIYQKSGCPNCGYNFYKDSISDTELFEKAKQLNKGLPVKIITTLIYSCIVQDETGQTKTISADELKQAVREEKIYLINYRLKSNGVLQPLRKYKISPPLE